MLQNRTFKFSSKENLILDRLKKKHGISYSQAIRTALYHYDAIIKAVEENKKYHITINYDAKIK